MRLPQSWWARVALAFAIFLLLKQPANAANLVNTGFSKLGDAGDQVGTFVNHLGK